MRVMVAAAVCSGVAACAPLTPEAVRRACVERADAAGSPRGSVALGIGSGGMAGSLGIEVSDDFLRGRDPALVYERCMAAGAARLEQAS